MRNKFGDWILSAVQKDSKILLLSGDIGFGIFDKFIEKYPSNFLNCGIAEQNMIGVASGLAAKNFKPVVYMIIPFLIYRPYEFIRNLIAYQNMNVTLIGVGGGFSYDNLGFTHFGLEDINLIQTLPHFTILTPYDPLSSELCYEYINHHTGPKYIRLMKGGENNLIPNLIINNVHIFCDYGTDFTIISHGSLVEQCIIATDLLNQVGIHGKVLSTLNANDTNFVTYLNGKIYSFEEAIFPGHFIKHKINEITQYFVDNSIDYKFGTRENFLEINSLDSHSIYLKIMKDLS